VEDAPDPKQAIDEKCEASCTKAMEAYDKCKERIDAKVRRCRALTWLTAPARAPDGSQTSAPA